MHNIGYSEFVKIFKVESSGQGPLTDFLSPGIELRKDGVWIVPPPDDALLAPEERAVLSRHPEKDLTKPALAFPCSFKQLQDFLEFLGLHDYFGSEDIAKIKDLTESNDWQNKPCFSKLNILRLKEFANIIWLKELSRFPVDSITLYRNHCDSGPYAIYAVIFELNSAKLPKGSELDIECRKIEEGFGFGLKNAWARSKEVGYKPNSIQEYRQNLGFDKTFSDVYNDPPKDDFWKDWVFSLKKSDEEMPMDVKADEPHVVLFKEPALSLPVTPAFLSVDWQNKTAQRARFNGAITLLDLIYIMACDEGYNDILWKLWQTIGLDNKGIKYPLADSSIVNHVGSELKKVEERIELWLYIWSMLAWTEAGQLLFSKRLNRHPPRPLRPSPLYYDLTCDREVSVDADRDEGCYVKLDELTEYLGRIKNVFGVSVPLPGLLFPEVSEQKQDAASGRTSSDQNDSGAISDKRIKVFPCPPNTKWKEITFELIEFDVVRVKTPIGKQTLTLALLGLTKINSPKKPTQMAILFAELAKFTGRLDSHTGGSHVKHLTKTASRLNTHLQKLFGITESIFRYHYNEKKAYITSFTIGNSVQIGHEIVEEEASLFEIEKNEVERKLGLPERSYHKS